MAESSRRGPALDAITLPDDADAWAAAGFDVVDDRVRIGPLVLRLVGAEAAAPTIGLTVAGTPSDRTELDGLRLVPADDRPLPPEAGPTHPNGVTGIDHVVVMTPDLERTVTALVDAGFDERRRRAVPGAEPPMTQVFFWAGEVIIELVGPDTPTGDGPARLWGIALVADDLDRCHAHLGESSSAPRAAVQPGRRILALRHRDLGLSLSVAVMTPHTG